MITKMNNWHSHVYRWVGCIGMLYNTLDALKEEDHWTQENINRIYPMVWHGYMNCLSDGGAIWNDVSRLPMEG